jgi:type VI secretion system secreted protein VgrG
MKRGNLMSTLSSNNGSARLTGANGGFTQKDRLLSLTTPLGDDALLVQSLYVEEAISTLFRINLQLFSLDPNVPFEKLAGQGATVRIKLPDGSKRLFHGHVSRLAQVGGNLRFTVYNMEVVPWLWFLTRTSDCRIFQNLTVPEMVAKVFRDQGFGEFRDNTTQGRYAKWDYCVQYRETDFNFVSRLMEQEGIFYYFEHDATKHILVLADAPSIHAPCQGQATAKYRPDVNQEAGVTGWQSLREVRPEKYVLRDYHFEMPDKSLETSRPSIVNVGGGGKLEIFDYPGEYAKKFIRQGRSGEVQPEGDKVDRTRLEGEEAPQQVLTGSSTCRTFAAGKRFALTNHPVAAFNDNYVLTAVQHSAVQDANFVSGIGGVGSYSNSFTCIPLRVPFRPARVTPKPIVQGPQTAVVVGTPGEELSVDRFGRVKVQFFWDRLGKKDLDSSCWVRVAQFWAGKRWGASFWPRVGQEVIVDFLEGDPDQPVIVGSLYNAKQMPPYLGDGLDAKHANDPKVSGVKSCSTPDGEGFNEIRFDDTKGKEQLFLRAEKTMDVHVNGSQQVSVGGDRNLTVGGSCVQKAKNKYTVVTGDVIVDATGTHQVTAETQFLVGSPAINLKGKASLTLKAPWVYIKGDQGIGLVCGSSFINIMPDEIFISAPQVHINSGGEALAIPKFSYVEPRVATGADDSKSGFPSNT